MMLYVASIAACCVLHAIAACCMLHAIAACCKSYNCGVLYIHRAQCHASAQTFTLCRKSARHSPALAGVGCVATQCTPVRALQHAPLRLAARCRMLSSGRSSPHMLSPRELAAADAEVGRALRMPRPSLQARPRRQLCFHTLRSVASRRTVLQDAMLLLQHAVLRRDMSRRCCAMSQQAPQGERRSAEEDTRVAAALAAVKARADARELAAQVGCLSLLRATRQLPCPMPLWACIACRVGSVRWLRRAPLALWAE